MSSTPTPYRVLDLPLLDAEVWWGGAVNDGVQMPFGPVVYQRDLAGSVAVNQCAPFLVSNKGRYVWNDQPFAFAFEPGKLHAETSYASEFVVKEGFASLREAYLDAARNFFPANGQLPNPLLFTKPQYNTWIELHYEQAQDKVIEYAEAVIRHGFPPGVLMIDDTWQEDYGNWDFHPKRFPNPKAMVARLHELGFEVMLWTCPFVSADSTIFRSLRDQGLLVRGADGDPVMRKWWNGHSAVLDGSNPKAIAWFMEQLQRLMADYAIDGFKFDAGDADFYRDADVTAQPITANGQTEAWARVGLGFSLNEYRACWKCAGLPLVQRLADKSHKWGDTGLASLIPNGLAQGLMGYAFICPDMIGGGMDSDFYGPTASLDGELFVRSAQCAALFPMMQFSAAPWRVLSAKNAGYCLETTRLHERLAPEIEAIARDAAQTGEPILRHMAYEFPTGGYEFVADQFMLGSEILVAPVITQGDRRLIRFPAGAWRGDDGSLVHGPTELEVDAPLSRLPWYRRERA